MVQQMDFTPNINIPPDLFANVPVSGKAVNLPGILQNLSQGQAAAQELQRRRALQQQMQMIQQMYPQIAPFVTSENMGDIGTAVAKDMFAKQKPFSEFQPVSGGLSEKGTILEFDKSVPGKIIDTGVKFRPTAGSAASYAGVRKSQFAISDLPSRSSPNTAAGAAYGVKVAARQGKSLVAKPGSAQRIALGSGDIARAVLRAAPQLDAQRGADFSQNIVTRWSGLAQRFNADPSGPDAPKIRREMYDILDELDKAATPWIENQLDTMENSGFDETFKDWKLQRSHELAENIAEVPFEEGPVAGQTYADSAKEKRYQEYKRTHGYQ